MKERIFDVYWEGPFKWGDHEKEMKDCHVLYSIYGTHPVYGHEALLYIGKTENIENRMLVHAEWIEDEYDIVNIRVASMGELTSWDGWDAHPRYGKARADEVADVEALLIYAHQPAYNKIGKDGLQAAKGYRIFNTGKIGSLLPEVSYRYQNPNGEW